MRTFHHIAELRAHLRAAREEGLTIGLVPTMGALHEGHLALVRRAENECDRTVVSIFVNPTQFGPNEDYDRYPRDLARDSRLCEEEGVEALFAPSVEEMYPCVDGVASPRCLTTVHVSELTDRFEGQIRPGHFDGVATVCAKLFQIVQPHRAYFGQKDYQQLLVIQRMVADLNMPLIVVPVATVRDSDGLAMSSRNAYLSAEERMKATVLPRALQTAVSLYEAGERYPEKIERAMQDVLAEETGARVDYAAVVDPLTLAPLETVEHGAVALAAIRIGSTRLIDNMLLGYSLNQHLRRSAGVKG